MVVGLHLSGLVHGPVGLSAVTAAGELEVQVSAEALGGSTAGSG